MMTSAIRLPLFLVLCLMVSSASAQQFVLPFAQTEADPPYIGYHPESRLTIGAGYDPADMSRAFPTCIATKAQPFDEGTLETRVSTYVVTSASAMEKAYHFDVKMRGSYLGGSASGRYDQAKTESLSEHSIAVVLTASSEYARRGYPEGLALTEDAKALLSRPQDFKRRCGTRFVHMERRGARLSVAIRIEGVTQELREAIVIAANVKGGIGPVSGQASAHLQAAVKTAEQMKRMSIEVLAHGGDGLGAAGDLVKSAIQSDANLDKIGTALQKFMETFSAKNAAPIGFHIASFDSLQLDTSKLDVWTDFQERKLQAIADNYREFVQQEGIAKQIATKEGIWHKLVSSEAVQRITRDLPLFDDRLAKIALVHKQCKESTGGDVNPCALPQLDQGLVELISLLPRLPRPPSGTFRIAFETRSDVGTDRWQNVLLGHLASRPLVYEIWNTEHGTIGQVANSLREVVPVVRTESPLG